MVKWGLEEEIFVTEPEKPGLESLYYLTKLLADNPRFYYYRTASNFARGRDVLQGLMSCIEISTSICNSPEEIIADLADRRRDLIDVCDGLIVPMGHLINFDAPTNTAALQIHLSGMRDMEKAYANIVHFLPVLALLSANAPAAKGKYYGKSYRMAKSYAIGPLTDNPLDRFQDIIFAKRLNTLEIRIFDPFWDLKRLKILLDAIDAVINLNSDFKLDIAKYNRLREVFVKEGVNEEITDLAKELSQIADFQIGLINETPGDAVWQLFKKSQNLEETYSALDNAYRNGQFIPHNDYKKKLASTKLFRKFAGITAYYLPRLPFVLYKYFKES